MTHKQIFVVLSLQVVPVLNCRKLPGFITALIFKGCFIELIKNEASDGFMFDFNDTLVSFDMR